MRANACANPSMKNNAAVKRSLYVLPCMSSLSNAELDIIGDITYIKKFIKNDVVFTESDAVSFIFIVKAGSIKLYKISQEGRELIVKIMGPGDYFCCASLFIGGRHSVSAIAVKDSTLIAIPADSFKKALRDSVGVLGFKIIAGLCSKIKYLSGVVDDITFKDVEQRVILTLMKLAEEKATDDHVFLALTHKDIASMTGTVREVVSRIMSKLKKNGIISDSSSGRFKIHKSKLSCLVNKKTCGLV